MNRGFPLRTFDFSHLRLFVLSATLAIAHTAWGGGTVTNATQADLQAALNGGGTVLFGVSGTIILTNTLTIAQDTVIDASGYALTISGGNAVRLFQVNSNVAFSLRGLTLANGRFVGANGADGTPTPPQAGQDGFGGGILNLGGTVALTDCALTNHSAQGGSSGKDFSDPIPVYVAGGTGYGAALCNLGGALSLTNCLLAANSALGGTSTPPDLVSFAIDAQQEGPGFGGAIYSANGQLSLQGVTLQANSASGGPAVFLPKGVGGAGGQGFGGAIYATNSVVVLSGSVLEGNSARGSAGAGLGGALCLDQGSSGVIQLCRFLGNAANVAPAGYDTPGGDGLGGAVFSVAALQIWSSTFSSNRCAGGTDGVPAGAACGGAVCSTNGLMINGSTFDHNLALGGSSAALGGIIAEPGALGEGGAIWSSGTLAATNSTWTTNQATGGAGSPGPGLSGGGGGSGDGGAVCIAGGRAVFVNVTIAGGQVVGGLGSPAGLSQGGGLFNTNSSVLVLNSIVANSLSGGDVWGAVTDGGYNICSDGTAAFSATGSSNKTNPLLGPLAANGGPTETMALLPGSPALDAIPSAFPAVDQRGVSRPQASLADIGAYEALAANSGPLIVTQPQGGMVRWGASVTLDVAATAGVPLTYQWFKDGAAIAGATNSLLSMTNVQAASAGAYWVDVTSAGVLVTSQQAVLTVDSTPLIVSLPANVVISIGGSASFTVLAQGPALTYQWWHNDSPIPGATNATLVVEIAQPGAQGAYDVAVSNFAGSVISPAFELTFDASCLSIPVPPPSSQAAYPGDSVTLSVTAAGVSPFAYQWQSEGTNVPGATNTTFLFTAPAAPGTYHYSVHVVNSCGDASEPADLEVLPPGLEVLAPPPASLTVNAGGSVSLNITVTGAPPFAYQWQLDGLGVPGATNASFTFTAPVVVGTYPYGVLVTNAYGDISEPVELEVVAEYYWETLAGSAGQTGSADGAGSAARFNWPEGLAVDGGGNLYTADYHNDTVRKITAAGAVSTLAGSPGQSGAADGTGSAARLSGPQGVGADGVGNVYVADSGNNTIRKITPAGVVSTLAGSPGLSGSTDGTGSAARFNHPQGVTVDGLGYVYVADTWNHTIRKMTPAGTVVTLAGSPGRAGSADGAGSAAGFYYPEGLAVDSGGNVYVADSYNDTVRKITPAGVVSTLAGGHGLPAGTDGIGSDAQFQNPSAVAVDGAGNLYVTDYNNCTIRKITPDCMVTTIGGLVGDSEAEDGLGAAARFYQPYGIAVDGSGNVYVADKGNDRIVKGVPPASTALAAGSCAMTALASQPNSLPVAALLECCTAPAGDTPTVTGVSANSSRGGTEQLSGQTITYTPAAGFLGADFFLYAVTDSSGASAQGTVTVTVIAGTTDPTLAITLLSSNSVAIRFAGILGTTYNVEASTDLVHWIQTGAASVGTNGWFQFMDTITNGSQARYYRTRVP
jgi:hypothetical protein